MKKELTVALLSIGLSASAAGLKESSILIPKGMGPMPLLWQLPQHPLAGTVKLLNTLERGAHARASRAQEPVVAFSCDKDAPAGDFINMQVYEAPPPPTNVRVTAEMLARPAEQTNDLFNVIKLTKLGRAVLDRFIPKFGVDVSIRNMTAKDLESISSFGRNVPLAFYRNTDRSIYINRSEERGRVAFILLHEIVHSLDRETHLAQKKSLELAALFDVDLQRTVGDTARRRQKREADLQEFDYAKEDLDRLIRRYSILGELRDTQMFRAERVAHDSSYDVWKELASLYPEYYRRQPDKVERAIRNRRPTSVKSVNEDPSYYDDETIVRTSQLNGDLIDKFKAGRCTPLHKAGF